MNTDKNKEVADPKHDQKYHFINYFRRAKQGWRGDLAINEAVIQK